MYAVLEVEVDVEVFIIVEVVNTLVGVRAANLFTSISALHIWMARFFTHTLLGEN